MVQGFLSIFRYPACTWWLSKGFTSFVIETNWVMCPTGIWCPLVCLSVMFYLYFSADTESLDRKKIWWELVEKGDVKIPFDGVPFVIIGTELRECQHGPNRHRNSQKVLLKKMFYQDQWPVVYSDGIHYSVWKGNPSILLAVNDYTNDKTSDYIMICHDTVLIPMF